MAPRLFNLILCALLLGLCSPAAKAVTRPENRVGGSAVFSSDFAPYGNSKTIAASEENAACGYDFASGTHKYLYGEDDPVDNSDPSGHDIGELLTVISISGMLDALPGLSITPIQAISHGGAIYPVVVVTLPNGTQYMPETKVKNGPQAAIARVPINTQIYIAVPEEVDPQDLVKYWTEEKRLGPLRDNFANFLNYWRPGGSHDYKRLSPIFDAFGNFGYGATGYSAGFSLARLQLAADEAHGNLNNPINSADILSGFNATSKSGKLRTKTTNLVPPLPIPSLP